MKSVRALVAAAICLGAAGAHAADRSPEVQKIVGAAYLGRALDDLAELTEHFGPRVTGSPLYDQAVDWAAGRFRAMGLDVHTESFTMKHSWARGESHARILAPQARPLRIEIYGWSPPTQAGGITGEIYVVKDFSAEGIAKDASNIRGKIVLIERSGVFSTRNYVKLMKSVTLLHDAGAVAFIIAGKMTNGVLNTGDILWGEIPPMPAGTIGAEDAATIKRWLDKGAVRIEMTLGATVGGPVQVRNVVAELRGREKPDEFRRRCPPRRVGLCHRRAGQRLGDRAGDRRRALAPRRRQGAAPLDPLRALRRRGARPSSARARMSRPTTPSSASASPCSTPTTARGTPRAGRSKVATT